MRRGFTLLEMLVATSVFMIGFTAVMGLFLMGARYRKQADDLLRCSLAAANIVEELRLMPHTSGTRADAYLGRGTPGESDSSGKLYNYSGMSGVWYRVEKSSEAVLDDASDTQATAIQLRLLVITADNPPNDELTLDDINRQLRLLPGNPAPQTIADELVKRGIALDYPATIVRKPHWLP